VGFSRLGPATPEGLHLGGGSVELVDHQIEVRPVFADLGLRYALEYKHQSFAIRCKGRILTVSVTPQHFDPLQLAVEIDQPLWALGVEDDIGRHEVNVLSFGSGRLYE
jgi:hypothetical protein